MGSALKCSLMISKDKCENVKSSYLDGLLQLQSLFCVQFSCKKESKQPELSTSLQKPTSELTGNVIQHRNFPIYAIKIPIVKYPHYINMASKFSWRLQDKNQPMKMTFFSNTNPRPTKFSTCHTTRLWPSGEDTKYWWMVNAIALKLRFFAMNGRGYDHESAMDSDESGRRWQFTTFTSPTPSFTCQGVLWRSKAPPSRGRFSSFFEKKTFFVFVLNASRCGDCKSQLLKMSVTCWMGVTNRKTNKAPKLAVVGF